MSEVDVVGYVVLAKRADNVAGGDTTYSPVSSVWSTVEPCENHAGWCAAKAEAEPERYGGVEYVVAALSIPSGVSKDDVSGVEA